MGGGRWGQRCATNNVNKERGKANTTLDDKRQSGRWGTALSEFTNSHPYRNLAIINFIRIYQFT